MAFRPTSAGGRASRTGLERVGRCGTYEINPVAIIDREVAKLFRMLSAYLMTAAITSPPILRESNRRMSMVTCRHGRGAPSFGHGLSKVVAGYWQAAGKPPDTAWLATNPCSKTTTQTIEL